MKKTIKKFVTAFMILAMAFMFSSCIEVEHTIYKEKGNFVVRYKMLLDKTLLAMMGEDGDDIAEVFDEISHTASEAYIRQLRKIDNDSRLGFSFEVETAKIRYQDIEENEMLEKLVPSTKGNEITISLFYGDDNGFSDSDDISNEMLAMMMSNYSYTVNIDSSAMKNARVAELYDTEYGKIETFTVEKISENMSRISIPMMTVLSTNNPVLRIR